MEEKLIRGANALESRLDLLRVKACGEVSTEPEKNGAICSVTQASQRQGPIKIDLHAMYTGELVLVREVRRKVKSRRHGPHGVGAGWANADFVEVEEAGHRLVIGWS